jgi:hypothetical protein
MNTQNSLFNTQYLYRFYLPSDIKYFDVMCIFANEDKSYYIFNIIESNSSWRNKMFKINKEDLKSYRYVKIGNSDEYPEFFI